MNEVRIFGLGSRVPEETTLETLLALEECAAVFSALRDERAAAWLKKRAKGAKPYRDAKAVLAAARGRGPVGLAVWGHPQFSSEAARRVERLCRAEGVPCRVYGAVSPVGAAFARSISFLGGDYGYQGLQAYELETLLGDPTRWTPRLPLVAYAESGAPARWKALARVLGEKLGPAHELRVYPVGSDAEKRTPLSRFPSPGLKGAVVLVPPASGAPKSPKDMAA